MVGKAEDTGKKGAKTREIKLGGGHAQASPHPLPAESHKMHFIPPATHCNNPCEMYPPGKLIRDTVTEVFIGGWPYSLFCHAVAPGLLDW